MLGEAQQQPHGPRLDPSGLSISRNLAGGGIDAPGADAKHSFGGGFHAGSSEYAVSLNGRATPAEYTNIAKKHGPLSGRCSASDGTRLR
jgi:hypothetical protein